MKNISNYITTQHFARARGRLRTSRNTIKKIVDDNIESGDVLELARAAGIQAARKTSDLLIFHHNLAIDWVDVAFTLDGDSIIVTAEAETVAKTGVEMEAMTAANVALLNLYDMLSPYDKELDITNVRLLKKSGGRDDFSELFEHPVKAVLLRISDGVVDGSRRDNSSAAVEEELVYNGVEIIEKKVIRSQADDIRKELETVADSDRCHLIFTIGATGLEKADKVSDITANILEVDIPGITEAIRGFGRHRTPYANYSRTSAGIRGNTIIVNLPGSSRGATESIQALFPGLKHALRMMSQGKLRRID
jgi:molybdenum cofactor biosynthesis protein MoaC